ncbi:MAG: alpha/beta fold hydrolase [Verrucomicrobia bacterium]|nr:alpha/beta fold hydrolase [Verrucomicrobiota bacterium]
MSRIGPPSEFRLKTGIARLLAPGAAQPRPTPYSDKLHLLAWRDAKGFEHPVTTQSEWQKRRADILANMQSVMGPLPGASRKVPLDVRVIEEARLDRFTRRKITFASEAGDRVPAWLLLPHDLSARAPAVLCLHQTTPIGKDELVGLGGRTNRHFAPELAERGFVVLAPDYPNFGEYRFDAYARGYASATMKGLWNHRRAVDVLESLPQVDRERIGVLGHSLGGHNALFAAAFDPRLKAVVSSCGFNSFFKYRRGDLTGWSHAGYMPRIASAFGKDPKQMPFDFTEVLAALAPRPVFINAPMRDDNFEVSGVRDCIVAATPVYRLWQAERNLVAQHPDCEHDFPVDVRAEAYAWLDRQLKRNRGLP